VDEPVAAESLMSITAAIFAFRFFKCDEGDLITSEEVFQRFAPLGQGVFSQTWQRTGV
jgi:hypothetical protein